MKLSRREFLSGLLKVSVVAPIVPATAWFARDESVETEELEPDESIDGVHCVAATGTYHAAFRQVSGITVWNDVLSDADTAILSKGCSPLLVRPQNLEMFTTVGHK